MNVRSALCLPSRETACRIAARFLFACALMATVAVASGCRTGKAPKNTFPEGSGQSGNAVEMDSSADEANRRMDADAEAARKKAAGTTDNGGAPAEDDATSGGRSGRDGSGAWGTDRNGGTGSGSGRDASGMAAEGAPTPELPNVLFAFDSFELSETAKGQITKNAAWLKSNPAIMVVLRGHTDDQGTPEYNMSLGSRRAQAVLDALVSEGVAADRLETVSFGEDIPAAPGEDESARAQNRRVEFFIYTR